MEDKSSLRWPKSTVGQKYMSNVGQYVKLANNKTRNAVVAAKKSNPTS